MKPWRPGIAPVFFLLSALFFLPLSTGSSFAAPAKPVHSAGKVIPPYNAKFWREKKGVVTDSDRERMAKFTAYTGGVAQPDSTLSESEKAQLTIKNDRAFRKHLKTNRLKFLDSIDKDTGLQATLVQDLDTKRVFILVRGTEFDRQKKKDGWENDTAGAGSGALTIGKKQYESGKKQFSKWIDKYQGNIEVIGHSLGGTISQRIFLDNAEKIRAVTVFNSPAIEVGTVSDKVSRPSELKKLMNPDGTYKLNIYNVTSDILGYAGGVPVPSNVVLAEGGALEKGKRAAHSQLIFGPSVTRKPVNYASYAMKRDQSETTTDYVAKDLGRRLNNFLNRKKNINANPMFDFVMRTQNFHFAIQRQIKLKALAKRKAAKRLARLARAGIATGTLDLEEGRIKPLKKKAAPHGPPVASAQPPKKSQTPAVTVGAVDGQYTGDYIAQRVDLADGASVRNGKIGFRISGASLDGKVTGQFVLYGNPNGFSAKINGNYDPASGRISAKIKGRWHGGNGGGLIIGRLTGARTAKGFKGKWQNENSSGTWSAEHMN